MEVLLIALAGAALGAVLAVWYASKRARPAPAPVLSELDALRDEMRRLGERVSADTSLVSQRLEGIDTRMTTSQNVATEMAQSIFDTLGDVRRATTTVADQAREFSALQDLLRPPKARGGMGEAMLEELLRQVLPPKAFSMQHRFTTGAIVDAVVHTGGKIVGIDSKFPLANYRRMCDSTRDAEREGAERDFAADVERHIRAIATRYIVPDEGTFDFAVMYVPAEGVYGEILRLQHRRRPLFETALEARVVPLSPLTMYGYLQTILYGLKCLRIEESASQILASTARLQTDIERFAADYATLGHHIANARGKYEQASSRLQHFRGKLDRIVDLAEETDDPDETPPPLELVAD